MIFSRDKIRELLNGKEVSSKRDTDTINALVKAGHLKRNSDDQFEFTEGSTGPIIAKGRADKW